ncbi:SWIM zinc finger family protein [Frankia sp. Ag45/Mut15]|uniref:SWIM zinc finger family protein n=1 Tax=Frankia umida TaxID=573489 RepID=A0ABT0JVF9_9ACTN|nr:SWIM zinc finger family protein [Frankia umida]MCK9875516.1 SWIM zinc finger family protein [Frankia umida]
MSVAPGSSLAREAVLALAPDPASARAGERLGVAARWSELGREGGALWGACRGSGSKPYQVVALTGAAFAFTCTCPSRKFPCKHALGLLFLAGAVPGAVAAGGAPPDWAAGWLERRAARAAPVAGVAAGVRPAGRAASSARTLARREARVDGGVAELDRWLLDLARGGLGAAQAQRPAWWEATAARMVDAQAPGLAEAVREMGLIAARGGPDWPGRLTDRLARLHLLCQGWSRRAELPPALVEVVRDRVGFTRSSADVLAGERRHFSVDVLGDRLFVAGKLQGRRQWLRVPGAPGLAQLVSYGAGKQTPPPGLPALSRVQAVVAAYPGRRPTRLALADAAAPEPLTTLVSGEGTVPADEAVSSWVALLAAYAAMLQVDPWADPVAFVVHEITVLPPHGAAPWLLRDRDGQALPLAGDIAAGWGWWLLAVGGGHRLDLAVEWDGFALTPLSAVRSPVQAPAPAVPAAPEVDEPPAVRAAPGWSRLIDAAVVGTGRAAVPDVPELARALGRDDGAPVAAELLLRTAALAAGARRAGQLPTWAAGLPAPAQAPSDQARVLAPEHARLLEEVLAGSQPEALRAWLTAMAETGWHAPAELLCDLLSRGQRESDLRMTISRVLGARGRWLADLHPDGAWALAVEAAHEASSSAASGQASWATAKAATRRTLLRQLRQHDPAAAAALLRGPAGGPAFAPFDQATAAQRVAYCEILRTGLGPWDVDLLDHALGDRRADVAQAAVRTALALPGAGIETRAARRTDGLLTVTRHGLPGRRRHRLEFATPIELTDEMRRDQITDPRQREPGIGAADYRAMLLYGELARVDPARWAERSGLTPAEFLAAEVAIAGVRHAPAARMRDWLRTAVIRHAQPEWVLALIPYSEPGELARLVNCLAEPARAEALGLALQRCQRLGAENPGAENATGRNPPAASRPTLRRRSPAELAAVLLTGITGPWSAALSRTALATITTLITGDAPDHWAVPPVRQLLTTAAWRLAPDAGFDALAPDAIAPVFAGDHAQLRAALDARRQLYAALATPPSPDHTGPPRPARLVQEGPR